MTRPADGPDIEATGPSQERGEVVKLLSVRLRIPLRRFFEKRHIPRDDIDDLIQEVFVRLAGRPGVENMERLEAYLFTTASNLLRDRHRRMETQAAQVHDPYDETVHGSQLASPGPERILLGAQTVEQLVAALYELPERTRVVFTLYHIEDLPHREIARRLGIAVSTIEKHMGRANAYLTQRLDGL
jgi:RNA polymerase sigma-70 factor (ECF subfamily)